MCIAFLILLISSVSVTFAPEFYSFALLQFIIGGSGHGAFVAIAVISTYTKSIPRNFSPSCVVKYGIILYYQS